MTEPAPASATPSAAETERPCARCGDAASDAAGGRDIEGKRLCGRCAGALEADLHEGLRRELWGRADAYVVLFGVVCPIATLTSMWWAPPLEAAFAVGGAAIFIAYLLRRSWARKALFILPLIGSGLALRGGAEAGAGPVLGALLGALLGGALAWHAYVSPRNRLAFRLPTGQRAMRRLFAARRRRGRAA